MRRNSSTYIPVGGKWTDTSICCALPVGANLFTHKHLIVRINSHLRPHQQDESRIKALETDSHRPKRDRRSALKLFDEIKAVGFTGGYSRVTEFIRRWQGGAAAAKAYIPLEFELGETFLFDWSEERLVIGGVWCKILATHPAILNSKATS